MGNVAQIIKNLRTGGNRAADRLLCAVSDELRRLGARKFARDRPSQTLQPSAIAHEPPERHECDARVSIISGEFGFDQVHRPVKQLSGGCRLVTSCAVRTQAHPGPQHGISVRLSGGFVNAFFAPKLPLNLG